jgi:hypothetical protein
MTGRFLGHSARGIGSDEDDSGRGRCQSIAAEDEGATEHLLEEEAKRFIRTPNDSTLVIRRNRTVVKEGIIRAIVRQGFMAKGVNERLLLSGAGESDPIRYAAITHQSRWIMVDSRHLQLDMSTSDPVLTLTGTRRLVSVRQKKNR